MQLRPSLTLLFALTLFLVACTPMQGGTGSATLPHVPTATARSTPVPASFTSDNCPSFLKNVKSCYTPHALRVAYGLEALTERGFTGKGQTIVDIVSFGSPTLQADLNLFSKQFGLPLTTVRVIAPLGTVAFDTHNEDMVGWAEETELDVQIIHAVAPDTNIIVMTSPVAETEGTIGLPEFLKLEQYAVQHHLGQIFSQSYVASEATLTDSAGQQLVKTYSNFYQQITTQQGWTVVSGSGDHGATDAIDLKGTTLAPTPTVNFPADVPWVTAVGGTSLSRTASGYSESAWPLSGGGFSKFFAEPAYQQHIPSAFKAQFVGHEGQRGIPDIAGDADPYTGLAFYIHGRWNLTGGTSASTPLWAAIIAVANQVAGHPLGFINPAIYTLGYGSTAHNDFRDITLGNNDVASNPPIKGFVASKGWDAVTGWGTPQADQFIPDLIAALK